MDPRVARVGGVLRAFGPCVLLAPLVLGSRSMDRDLDLCCRLAGVLGFAVLPLIDVPDDLAILLAVTVVVSIEFDEVTWERGTEISQ